ncbi:uncharacterized protein LOC142317753 [Lycorma delicatula]|uniref:uncharacterized protein LOC142317753 n=1 Tax=Lycorma delicatula TaxID=130591 RepID=UPI003F515664
MPDDRCKDVPLFKKGDKKVLKNDRGMILIYHAAKIFERILEKGIRRKVESQLEEKQYDFRWDNQPQISSIVTVLIILDKSVLCDEEKKLISEDQRFQHELARDWISFKKLFTAVIDKSPDIDEVHKLYYLRQSLKGGSAAKLIELAAQNYKSAWELLTKRFKNERLIIERHIKALFDYPKLDKDSSFAIRQMIDETNIHIRALKSLKQPTDTWDTMLVYLLATKLDYNSVKEWQIHAPPNRVATFAEFLEFLDKRAQTLEAVATTCQGKFSLAQPTKTEFKGNRLVNKTQNSVHFATERNNAKTDSCPICKKTLKIFTCAEFHKMSPQARNSQVMKLKLCLNCLRQGHRFKECKVTSHCEVCSKNHNTLFHNPPDIQEISNQSFSTTIPTSVSCISQIKNHNLSQIILATALIEILDSCGTPYTCRVLLDPGSSVNIMTEALCQKLKLHRTHIEAHVSGINNVSTVANSRVSTTIKSQFSNFQTQLDFIVLPKVTQMLPSSTIDTSKLFIPPNIYLADPFFYQPNKVDALIGAEVFYHLLCVGQIRLADGNPILQKTSLGWIISGKIPESSHSDVLSLHCCLASSSEDVQQQIEKFWSVEELHFNMSDTLLTGEDAVCEKIYCHTVKTNEEGRFIVQLPIKSNIINLCSTREIALRRFLLLEKRLNLNPELKLKYAKL